MIQPPMTVRYFIMPQDPLGHEVEIFNQSGPCPPVPVKGDEVELVDYILTVRKVRRLPLTNEVKVFLDKV